MTKTRKCLNSLIAFFYILTFVNCSTNDDDGHFLLKSEPIHFDFMTVSESSTRSTTLSTDKTVFVTADAGLNWFAYQYNGTNGVWKAVKLYSYDSSNTSQPWTTTTLTSGGITWSSQSMLIYAIVRNDDEPSADNVSPFATPITIVADQSEGTDNADFWGTVTQVSYTSGRIALNLQHQTTLLRIKITNCASEPTSCVSTTTFYTKGTVSVGSEKISIGSLNTASVLTLYKESYDATTQTASYIGHLLPNSSSQITFRVTNNEGTFQITSTTVGGLSYDAGATTLLNAKLPE